ncbi:MAG: AAA family ATPase [Kouleothrix sp.]
MGDLFALTPIAGRQHERAVLWGQLEAALGGRLRVALLAGEPGIGKTRLLDDLADRAGAAGMLVLRGGASDAAGMPPYLPLLEAIGQYVRSASDELLRTHTGALAPVLATIIPEIALRLGTLPASYPLPAEQARLRLFEAVGALLATLASAAGLAVVLDDLHWADQATLDLLGYIARRQPAARLLIVGAYREGEITEPAAFGRTIADLTRLHALATVAVGRLDAPDLDTLLSAYLGGPAEPDVGARLLAPSEGNPFFAEELLRSWMEAGALARAGASWRLDQSLAGPLPGSIVLAVRQRVARLTPACADLLRTAALIGRGFAPELLAEVAGQDIEHVEDLLVTATQAQLIRAAGAGLLSFSHDKIRECLYDEVPPQRRRRLHGLIGQALVARPEPAGAPQLAALAFHFTRSGDHEAGIAYSRRAAEQALRAHAPDSAIAHLRTALALLGANDNRQGELLLALGEAASAADRGLPRSRRWPRRGPGLCSAAIGPAPGGPHTARARRTGGSRRWARRWQPSAALVLEGQPSPELVLTLIDLANLQAMSLHQHEPGMAYSRRALALAHSLEDDRLVASASRAAGNIDVRNGNLAAGISLLEQALALADQADDPVEAAECCAQLSPPAIGPARRRARLRWPSASWPMPTAPTMPTSFAICTACSPGAHRSRAAGKTPSAGLPQPSARLSSWPAPNRAPSCR